MSGFVPEKALQNTNATTTSIRAYLIVPLLP
jgi:hypothetical protein